MHFGDLVRYKSARFLTTAPESSGEPSERRGEWTG